MKLNKHLTLVTESAGSPYSTAAEAILYKAFRSCSGNLLGQETADSVRTLARSSRQLSEVVDRTHSAVIAFIWNKSS